MPNKKPPSCGRSLARWQFLRVPLLGDASKQHDQLLWQREHETRAFERDGVCVVGTFVLAYPRYYTLCGGFIQYFLATRAKMYCTTLIYPHIYSFYPQFNGGRANLWISRTPVSVDTLCKKSTTLTRLWKTRPSPIITDSY